MRERCPVWWGTDAMSAQCGLWARQGQGGRALNTSSSRHWKTSAGRKYIWPWRRRAGDAEQVSRPISLRLTCVKQPKETHHPLEYAGTRTHVRAHTWHAAHLDR
jgi:hypothetical protein